MNARMMLGLSGVPGQPAVQPYLGHVGLVVTRRVPGSAEVRFSEGSSPLVQPLYTMCRRGQPLSILHAARHACNATSRLDCI